MGESILEAPNIEDKMGETASSNPVLEVSVSFGRFENDSLSWEKWSSFSPNKYLEEVEKCATPGSVAKKAAYFEAHYKKTIATRKAELLLDQSDGDLIRDNCRTNSESDVSGCQNSAAVADQENSLANEESGFGSHGDSETSVVCQSSSAEQVPVKEEEENGSMGMRDVKELQEKEMEETQKVKEETVKLHRPKESHKITPTNKDRNMSRIKKKATSSTAKAPQISTPKVSKPASNYTPVSSSRSSTKITNSSSLLRSKNFSAEESKKVAPKSLQSLSLGPSSSDPASLTTTRKSLIMEKMGDKDIVKRAFKTFQSNYNQLKSSSQEQSPASKQSGGSFKAASVEKKYAKAAQSSFALKSNERVEKTREVPKQLEGKSNASEAARRRLHMKPKEDKEAEIKKLRQNHNFKSTSMAGFYRGRKITKGSIDQEGSKKEIER